MPRLQDGAGGGMQRLGLEFQPLADGGDALGHPCAFVEHARDGMEGREIQFADFRPGGAQLFHGGAESRRLHLVAEDLQRRRVGHADAHDRGIEEGARGDVARIGVGRVVAGGDAVDGPGIGHRHREDRDRVEGAAGRHDARCRKRTERRFQPDDGVEGRRHAPRSGRVGAEREGDDAAGNRDRRSRRRTARHDRGIDGVQRHRMRRAHADEAGGELVEIGLAEHDGAGLAQLRDDEGVVCRVIGEVRASRRGRHSGDVDIVLHRERNAPERPAVGRLQRDGGFERGIPRLVDQDAGIVREVQSPERLGDDCIGPEPLCICPPQRLKRERQFLDHCPAAPPGVSLAPLRHQGSFSRWRKML